MENEDVGKNLKNVGNKIADRSKKIFEFIANNMNKNSENQLIELIILVIIGLVVVIFVFWAYSLTSMQDRECANLDKIYSASNTTLINPVATRDPYQRPYGWKPTSAYFDPSGGNARIFSYYVKTAYNCCSPGNFTNSFVSICALRHCVTLGARCLDFEIYSLDFEPVISTSSVSSALVSSFFIKETFNSLKLTDALYYIKYFALEDSNNGGAPNHQDPLFLHFRIMTNQLTTIDLIAKYLTEILGDTLLGASFGQNNLDQSLSGNALLQFCNRCIIMVESNTMNSATIEKSTLWPIVNIMTNSSKYKSLRASNITQMSDSDRTDLATFNKHYATIVLPDVGNESSNFNPQLAISSGCQFIGMNFQNFDSNLETYFKIFADQGYSYILKPCSLRYTPVHYLINYETLQKGAGCTTTVSNNTGATVSGNINGEVPTL